MEPTPSALIWATQHSKAITGLVDIWGSMEGDTRNMSAWDRELITHVQESVRRTLTGVTRALAIHSTGASKQSVFELTHDLIMASRHLDGLSHERAKKSLAMARGSVGVAALEKLLPALKAIDSGATQQAVAQICDWGGGVRSRKPRAA